MISPQRRREWKADLALWVWHRVRWWTIRVVRDAWPEDWRQDKRFAGWSDDEVLLSAYDYRHQAKEGQA